MNGPLGDLVFNRINLDRRLDRPHGQSRHWVGFGFEDRWKVGFEYC